MSISMCDLTERSNGVTFRINKWYENTKNSKLPD